MGRREGFSLKEGSLNSEAMTEKRYITGGNWYRNIYLRSKHWRSLRAAKLEDVGHRCQRCRRRQELEVHHLHYQTLWHERLTDLEVLCRRCHENHHHAEIEQKMKGITPKPTILCPKEADRLRRMGKLGNAERLMAELKCARADGNWGFMKELENRLRHVNDVIVRPSKSQAPKKKKKRNPGPIVTTFRCPICKNPKGTPHARKCYKGKIDP